MKINALVLYRVLWVMVFENLPFLNEIKDYLANFLLKFSKFQKKINKIQKNYQRHAKLKTIRKF